MTSQRIYIDPVPGYRSLEARQALLATRGRYMVVTAERKPLRTLVIRTVQGIGILAGFASWLLLMGLGDVRP